ncbi:ubiquilin-1-like [Candoia aspera]|uniref:ubiquilin-1-like n=1 Tax=Candoia aspera TaxID=51853 RepID=UPI002FD84C72
METVNVHQAGTTLGCPGLATNPNFICITAKSPQGSTQFVLPHQTTIQKLKEELSKHFHCETGQLVLVFFGRILKDQHTLQQCGVSDGMTVHLLIRPLKRDSEDSPQSSYLLRTSGCALTPTSTSLTLPAFNPSTQGPRGPPEVSPSSIEWQQMPTSEMIVQKVRQVILANPEIQQLAQQFPAICHILNNMGIMRVILDKMREIMDLAKNPDMMQDLKNPDPLLISVQSNTPGGDNPLRQLNSDVQEPGLNEGQDLLDTSSSYDTLARNPCPEHTVRDSEGLHLGSSKCAGSFPISHSSTSICTTSSCSDEGGIFNSLHSPLGPSSSLLNTVPTPGAGLCNVGGVQALIVNLCNAYTKRMMFSLMQNALLASKGMQTAQKEHVQQQLLHFSQQMQRPEMVAAMSNPKAIQAWVQMEQGLQALVAEAPVLIPWFILRLKGLGNSSEIGPMATGSPSEEESAALE